MIQLSRIGKIGFRNKLEPHENVVFWCEDKMKKSILIVYTGGTIGMSKSVNGYTPQLTSFIQELNSIQELRDVCMPHWDIQAMDPLLDSSNVSVEEWNAIAQIVADNYEKYDGFVILHGTDTMAYTASALSFMLENNNKPVIFTGSQIPLCEVRNDARDNLITALLIASNENIHEVCLYFGGKLLRGNRAIKFSANDLIAFMSPNYPALADVGMDIRYHKANLLKETIGTFHLQKLKKVPIGVIKVFPGIQFDLFESIMTQSLKGVVIETFGAGNIPANGKSLLPLIQRAFEHETLVTVTSQCPHGSVALGAYETSSGLKKAGALSGYDMTTEACVAKLYYLFSKNLSLQQIKELMEQDIRGELTKN